MKTISTLTSFTEDLMKEAAAVMATKNRTEVDTRLFTKLSASGRLLLHQLGSFGTIWATAFSERVLPGFSNTKKMLGALESIHEALEKGRLVTIQEMVATEILGDLMEHAEALVERKYMLPAAVILRAVLEERLRKLCEVNGLTVSAQKPTIEHFKISLVNGQIIDKVVAKQIDAMAGIGNSAAHLLPTFNPEDVPGLYRSVLDFLAKFSA